MRYVFLVAMFFMGLGGTYLLRSYTSVADVQSACVMFEDIDIGNVPEGCLVEIQLALEPARAVDVPKLSHFRGSCGCMAVYPETEVAGEGIPKRLIVQVDTGGQAGPLGIGVKGHCSLHGTEELGRVSLNVVESVDVGVAAIASDRPGQLVAEARLVGRIQLPALDKEPVEVRVEQRADCGWSNGAVTHDYLEGSGRSSVSVDFSCDYRYSVASQRPVIGLVVEYSTGIQVSLEVPVAYDVRQAIIEAEVARDSSFVFFEVANLADGSQALDAVPVDSTSLILPGDALLADFPALVVLENGTRAYVPSLAQIQEICRLSGKSSESIESETIVERKIYEK